MPLHTSDALAVFISLNEWLKGTYIKCASVSLQEFVFPDTAPGFLAADRGATQTNAGARVYLSPSREGLWILRRACVFLCFIPENKAWTVWEACIHCSELNLKFLDFQRTFSYVNLHSTSGTSKTWSFSCCRTCPVFLFQIFLIGSFKFRFFLKKY